MVDLCMVKIVPKIRCIAAFVSDDIFLWHLFYVHNVYILIMLYSGKQKLEILDHIYR